MIEVNDRTPSLIENLISVWEHSVKATHRFLSEKEIETIKSFVPQALKEVSHLIILQDEHDNAVAFMGIENEKLEMLFIAPEERGKGWGKKLIRYGMEHYGIRELTVNEQNPQAKGFYEHMGFHVDHRSDLDEQGNPYPLYYMKLNE